MQYFPHCWCCTSQKAYPATRVLCYAVGKQRVVCYTPAALHTPAGFCCLLQCSHKNAMLRWPMLCCRLLLPAVVFTQECHATLAYAMLQASAACCSAHTRMPCYAGLCYAAGFCCLLQCSHKDAMLRCHMLCCRLLLPAAVFTQGCHATLPYAMLQDSSKEKDGCCACPT